MQAWQRECSHRRHAFVRPQRGWLSFMTLRTKTPDIRQNVNWEATNSGNECPPWYKATQLAEQVLDMSDPLYNYHSASNVQCSRARITLGNRLAQYNIMSAIACPLDEFQANCSFTWLLEGDEREQHKIVGSTALSPKLLHTFAQITHLSTKLYKVHNTLDRVLR